MITQRKFTAALGLAFILFAAVCARAEATPPAPGKSATMDGIRQRGKIIAGSSFKFQNFNTRNPVTGEHEGFMVDIGKALAKRMLGDEGKIEWRYAAGKDNMANLRFVMDGRVDVIIDGVGQGSYSGFKRSIINFSDEIFPAGMALLVRQGSPIRGLEDLKAGTKVLVHDVSPDIGVLLEKAPDAKVIFYDDLTDGLEALRSGEGDALPHNVTHLIAMASHAPGLAIVGRFAAKPFGIASRKEDPEFARYLNEFVHELKASGEYDRLFQKWFGSFGPALTDKSHLLLNDPTMPSQ